MTIDEHIEQLKKLKSFHSGNYGASIHFAIDTMRKYQEIKLIANNKNINGDLLRMSEIRWVLENGNDRI